MEFEARKSEFREMELNQIKSAKEIAQLSEGLGELSKRLINTELDRQKTEEENMHLK